MLTAQERWAHLGTQRENWEHLTHIERRAWYHELAALLNGDDIREIMENHWERIGADANGDNTPLTWREPPPVLNPTC